MKYYLIAGEASGDLHGSNLMRGIRQVDPHAEFRYFGGDFMHNQGGTLVKHYSEMALMGPFHVLLKLRTISRNLKIGSEDILTFQPDVLILIDFAGFNLRIARYVKKSGIKIFYYISPKVWAWNKSRIKIIRELVDRMFVIFPFEVDFYHDYNYQVEYYGNPLLDPVEEKLREPDERKDFLARNKLNDKPVVALLPGSRRQEIELCLPEMLGVIPSFSGYQFIIAGAPGVEPGFYNMFLAGHDVTLIFNQTYDLLKTALAAMVTSGTATLETALMMVPEVVCYKTGFFTYHIGHLFIHPRFFSLVNLIMNEEVVKELLQKNLKEDLSAELEQILYNDDYRKRMLEKFRELKIKLGGEGASVRVAERVVELIKQ